ncbi:tyrosine-type recombinase/integrase [Bradyrhizobium jicamae]|uniref:tyrosine-type recombinase/integrase n=1 Tax=Bradyrhizobium jicamae TaxID=280332 RepID=UPI003908092B
MTEAAKGNRYGHRDSTMILVAYRHGLRASELVDLRWDQVDFENATGRPQRQEGLSQHSPHPRQRATRLASAGAGARSRLQFLTRRLRCLNRLRPQLRLHHYRPLRHRRLTRTLPQ